MKILVFVLSFLFIGCAHWKDESHVGPDGNQYLAMEYDSSSLIESGLSVDWVWECEGKPQGEITEDWVNGNCERRRPSYGRNPSWVAQFAGYAVIPAAALLRPDNSDSSSSAGAGAAASSKGKSYYKGKR